MFEHDPFPRYQPLLFEPARPAPYLPFEEIVAEMRAVHFPEIDGEIEVRLGTADPLAFVHVGFMHDAGHLIVFHPVLNHPGTPVEVVRFIAKHELTHIVSRGTHAGGEYDAHPPEFWAHERRVGPEHDAVWAWVRRNLGSCLRKGPDALSVTGRWRELRSGRREPYTPGLPFNGERWDRVCPGNGAQLALPASWRGRRIR